MIGKTIAHYRVLESIGAGGMGQVYRAHDTRLGRDVALKVLPLETRGDDVARARLLREARTASTLNHPNLCTVHEVGEVEGLIYVAMELIHGQPLSERIPPHGLAAETVSGWGAQIADALAHAHERGVIHRDLKTSNVMITLDGRVKVLDLGLAKQTGEAGQDGTFAPPLTSSGVVVGTPAYLAPELLRGEPADARSDLWALGVVLHEMATGARPFQGQTPIEIGAAILNAEPMPLPAATPAGLRAVILRLLAKDPARRYQRADEVRAALETLQSGSGAEAAASSVPAPTPRRALRSRLLTIGAILLPVLAFLGLALDQGGVRTRLFGGGSHIRSLAVLPLQNLSRDPEQEYFADGMTEELIASLANLEGVRVISRTSAMRYKGSKKDIPQIARELGVDAVIEGSALRAGDRVRITAQLIQGAADRHLWANSYDRDLRDVLALQSEVAHAIAAEIRTTLAPRMAAASRPLDPAAHEAYLKGRFYWNRRTPASLREAVSYFQQAIQIDLDYAPAHAGLAEVYVVMAQYTGRSYQETHPLARAAAERALRLDPSLASPHAVLGLMKANDYDWVGAEEEYQLALRLNPNETTARQWRAIALLQRGRFDEALAEIDRALEIDPLALIIRSTRGRILFAQRRFVEGLAEFGRVLELDPGFSITYGWIAQNDLRLGRFEMATANFRKADSLAGQDLDGYDRLARASRDSDPRAFWREDLRFLADSTHRAAVSSSVLALCYAQLGEADRAVAMLERAFAEHDPFAADFISDWSLDPIRRNPRFIALVRRYGLEP